MNPTPASRIVALIVERGLAAHQQASGWRCQCPAHVDQTPSLGIDESAHGHALLKCYAGCRTEDVLAALGLEMQDLFNRSNGAATYRYTRDDGQLAFTKMRFDNKGFGIDGNIEPLLYRQAEVRNAIARRERVYIVNGEKAVDILLALGVTATCGPFGESKWAPAWGEIFRGADVAIIVDRDAPGHKWASQVGSSIRSFAARVTLLQSRTDTEHADVYDHLLAGFRLDELERFAPEPIVQALDAVEDKQVSWLWNPYIPLGCLTLMEGPPGCGKSLLTATLAAAVSRGEMGYRRGAVILTREDALFVVKARVASAGGNLSCVMGHDADMNLADAPERLVEIAEQVDPALVVLDSLPHYVGRADMNDDAAMKVVLANLAKIAEEYNFALLALRHETKSAAQMSYIYRGMGSIGIAGTARSILAVQGNGMIYHRKSNYTAPGPPVGFMFAEGHMLIQGF